VLALIAASVFVANAWVVGFTSYRGVATFKDGIGLSGDAGNSMVESFKKMSWMVSCDDGSWSS